jgi:acyl-CoA synthetase (AMP-forming)/AMP-acid ligase II
MCPLVTLLDPAPAAAPLHVVDGLARRGDAVALVVDGGPAGADELVTYAELDALVEARRELLGTERRLVLVTASNTLDAVVSYLAALRGEHPVLLAAADDDAAVSALVDAYDPDVVLEGAVLDARRRTSRHDLHPELALLLSTSGSTGTPKLVRLSRANLDTNAAAIGEYLHLTDRDRAMTSLPMQYCYGLSVINSHLRAGAGLVLTELSVVDACFWRAFRRAGATSFAGVPHTFDLLDHAGFADLDLPTLRYVTQAGGRLRPETVRRYAELGAQRGWDLFVMYGQTEATARMAYLPPSLAASRPGCIGVPIPGGSLTIDEPDASGVGELVYRGDNVMLGYAEGPADLADGRTVHALRTGDLARRHDDGLIEIVGRRSRIVKPFGVRVDLDDLERTLAARGIEATCTGDDGCVVAGVVRSGATTAADVDAVTTALDDLLGLPHSHRAVVALDTLPRLPNGKPDHGAIRRAAARATAASALPDDSVRAAVADVLGLPVDAVAGDDTFVALGGDSMSYVEMSVRLEALVDPLPRDWHLRRIDELAAAPRAKRRRLAMLDTSVVLRAVAIVLVVGTHADLWQVPGGAHALVFVAGLNFARFQLDGGNRWASIARIALPSICWIGFLALMTRGWAWEHAVLLNDVLRDSTSRWAFWFVESLVQILVVVALVLAVPAVARLERRRPFPFAAGAVGVGLAFRYDLLGLAPSHHELYWPHQIFLLFALGWAAGRATRAYHRVFVTAVAVLVLPGFLAPESRLGVVLAAVLLVTWTARLPVPRALVPAVSSLAAASLAIYLTHMPVHLPVELTYGSEASVVVSLLVGLVAWRVSERVADVVGSCARRWSDRARYGRSGAATAAAPSGSGIACDPATGNSRTLAPTSSTSNDGVCTWIVPSAGSSTS